jgi:hypothetical protein
LLELNFDSYRNKIHLPVNASKHPVRSVHRGFHGAYNERWQRQLDTIYRDLEQGRISKAEARRRLEELMSTQRQALRKGEGTLNKAEDIDNARGIDRSTISDTSEAK